MGAELVLPEPSFVRSEDFCSFTPCGARCCECLSAEGETQISTRDESVCLCVYEIGFFIFTANEAS